MLYSKWFDGYRQNKEPMGERIPLRFHIGGLDKGQLLQALFHTARPHLLVPSRKSALSTLADAPNHRVTYFGSVPIYADLSGDDADFSWFDHYNFPGAAHKAIASVQNTR
jgi:hypothetical protein